MCASGRELPLRAPAHKPLWHHANGKEPMRTKTGRTGTKQPEFTLQAILDRLLLAGELTEGDCEELERDASALAASMAKELGARGLDSHYISPLEIVVAHRARNEHKGADPRKEKRILQRISTALGIPFETIDPLELDPKPVCSIISKPFARKHLMAPLRIEKDTLTVAMVNPFDREAIQSLEDVTGLEVRPVLGDRNEILKTINEIFAFEHSLMKAAKTKGIDFDLGNLERLVNMSGGEPDASDQHIINAVDLLLQYAYEQSASDIHLEPKRERAAVRLRIDGRLQKTHTIPKKVYPAFVSRIKIMAGLNIAERRKPQDGRIKTKNEGMEIELRISTVPTAFGEKVVIRIFDPMLLMQDLSSLGFLPGQLATFKKLIKRPHGIILVTGPTGSGKTTTLYSALRFLSDPEVNITTIEDPIEMIYEPFNQIAVQHQIGLDFTTALRHVLRQDPDIIMIGEIRDHETAEYAVQAALTGHLVLTTLHTNSAMGAVTRLRDLGIESFLIASTVLGLLAQRLLRRICASCTTRTTMTAEQMELLGMDSTESELSRVSRGQGCEYCRNTGYRGRRGVFELVEVNDRIRAMIRDGADEADINREARRVGAEPLLDTAIKCLVEGETTVEEILRVVPLLR